MSLQKVSSASRCKGFLPDNYFQWQALELFSWSLYYPYVTNTKSDGPVKWKQTTVDAALPQNYHWSSYSWKVTDIHDKIIFHCCIHSFPGQSQQWGNHMDNFLCVYLSSVHLSAPCLTPESILPYVWNKTQLDACPHSPLSSVK